MSLTSIRETASAAFCLLLAFASQAHAEAPTIPYVPLQSFDGRILMTEGKPTDQVRDIFWRIAGRYSAKLIVVTGDEPSEVDCQYPWQIRGSQATTVVRASEVKSAENAKRFADQVKDATAIWVHDLPQDLPAETRQLLQAELKEANQNKELPLGGTATTLLQVGLRAWLPAARFEILNEDSSNDATQKPEPGAYRVNLRAGDAFGIQDRNCINLGSRPILIDFSATDTAKAEVFSLLPGQPHDLIALARAAQFRWPSEATKKIEPSVPKGSLVIVGGGGTPRGLLQKFIELAGGEDAQIVVLPTAFDDPELPRDEVGEVKMLERAGAKNVKLLSTWQKKDVESAQFRETLEQTKGVWFGGGRQWRFVDAYAGTQAIQLFHDVLARGGVIGGSSAGASIQGDFMCRGNPLGNLDIDSFGYQQGFNFLPGTAIDQHFSQRNRLPDLMQLIRQRPQFLGVGLDETTAIVVQGSRAEVVGNGQAFFLDGSLDKGDEPKVHKVKGGGVFDLAKREPVEESPKDAETRP